MIAAAQDIGPEQVHVFEQISLSRNTLADRISEMGESIESQLREKCEKMLAFSLALDESTDVSNIAQLAIFVRGVQPDLTVVEEMLDLVPLKDTTTGEDIFNALCSTVEKFKLDWKNFVSLATDGAPSMTGAKRDGRVARLRKFLKEKGLDSIEFIAIHCFIHQEALLAQSVNFQGITKVVVDTVNFIRARGLNCRQFNAF